MAVFKSGLHDLTFFSGLIFIYMKQYQNNIIILQYEILHKQNGASTGRVQY